MYGPESTGKTTLSKQLAAHYNDEWIPEFARDFLQEKWDKNKENIRQLRRRSLRIAQ